jgi:hypothetical protein
MELLFYIKLFSKQGNVHRASSDGSRAQISLLFLSLFIYLNNTN